MVCDERLATRDMRRGTCDEGHATWVMRLATGDMPRATRDMRHGLCDWRHATGRHGTCDGRRGTCGTSIELSAAYCPKAQPYCPRFAEPRIALSAAYCPRQSPWIALSAKRVLSEVRSTEHWTERAARIAQHPVYQPLLPLSFV